MNKKRGFPYSLLRALWKGFKWIKCHLSYIKYRFAKPASKNNNNIIPITLSFTTYPARLKTLPLVVGSLLRQTRQPDRIVLYLSRDQFENSNPKALDKIRKKGVTVEFRDGDMKSHKKYLYAMREYPDNLIITVDDDLLYDKNLIEDLYQSYLRHPDAISAKRVHRIKFDENGNVLPYMQWVYEATDTVDKEDYTLFATTGAGTLFPPHCLDSRFDNTELIKKTCMHADDIWLKIMGLLKGTKTVLAKSNSSKLEHIWNGDTGGLAEINITTSGNDDQLKKICDEFNINLFDLINQ